MVKLTKREARRFLLLHQGLLGEYRFCGKQGVLDYIRQVGCIQYDPIDVCGKNAELTLHARVQGFQKEMLDELLYSERALFEYWDKNMSLIPIQDWPYFSWTRRSYCEQGWWWSPELENALPQVLAQVKKSGVASTKDIQGFSEKIVWPWGKAPLARAALEILYYRGELAIHHREGTIRFYTEAKKCIPVELFRAPQTIEKNEFLRWQVLRRIRAVGLLRRGPSDAFLGIDGMRAPERNAVFDSLLKDGHIQEVSIEETRGVWYCPTDTKDILKKACGTELLHGRTELLGPLDCLIWDRKLIEELFGFSYKWEIYTPVPKRKYGYYVLPFLQGERFIGRVECFADRKSGQLIVKRLWLEDGVRLNRTEQTEVEECLKRLAAFNRCYIVKWQCCWKDIQ